MHKQVCVHIPQTVKFVFKFSRKPLSGISDQRAPPKWKTSDLKWPKFTPEYPPKWKTSDLRWPKFTPEYPPPQNEKLGRSYLETKSVSPCGYHLCELQSLPCIPEGHCLITTHNCSCRNVMFLIVSVCPHGGLGIPGPLSLPGGRYARYTPSTFTGRYTSQQVTLLGRYTPVVLTSSGGHWSGQ